MANPKLASCIVGAILGAAIAAPLILYLPRTDEQRDADYIAVEEAARELRCPDGAKLEYRRWGKAGWMASCRLAHSPFVAAEHGRVVVRQEYFMGKEVGQTKCRDCLTDG